MLSKTVILPLAAFVLLTATATAQDYAQTTPDSVVVKDASYQKPVFEHKGKNYPAYIAGIIRYPVSAIKEQHVGNVVAQATIDATGKVSNIQIVSPTHKYLEQEVLNTLKKMPLWQPATKDGIPVASTHLFRFSFSLKTSRDAKTMIKPTTKPDIVAIKANAIAAAPDQPVFVSEKVDLVGYREFRASSNNQGY